MYYWPFAVAHETAVAIKPFYGDSPAHIHAHEYSELCIVQKGFCVHSYKNVELILVPGDMFLIPSGASHEYSWMADMSVINCHFYEEKIRPETRKIYDQILHWLDILPEEIGNVGLHKQGIVHFDSTEMQEIVAIMMQMHEEDSPKPLSETVKLAFLDILLCKFRRRQMLQSGVSGADTVNEKAYNLIAKAVKIIEEGMMEEMDVDEIARGLNISTSHFRKRFREITGLPPTNYLNRLRITKSIEYLNNTTWTVAEIAEAVGFLDPNYYTRMFKKYIGYSPQNYRKKLKCANS